MSKHIEIVITDDGLYSKWSGAELVSAIDSHNNRTVAYVLRNRRTFTMTTMLGRPEDPPKTIDMYVDALHDEGRHTVAIFKIPRDLYVRVDSETEREGFIRLAELIENNYFTTSLEGDDEIEEMIMSKQDKEEAKDNKSVN